MANKGLIIIGLLMIAGVFFVTLILFTPQQISQIEMANYLCNAEVLGIPVGQIGQSLSSDIAQRCEMVNLLMPIIKYKLYIIVIGFILMVAGVALGGNLHLLTNPLPSLFSSLGEVDGG